MNRPSKISRETVVSDLVKAHELMDKSDESSDSKDVWMDWFEFDRVREAISNAIWLFKEDTDER